jgi:hypothetical protein
MDITDDADLLQAVKKDAWNHQNANIHELLQVTFKCLTFIVAENSFLIGPAELVIDNLKANRLLVSSTFCVQSCFPGQPAILSLSLNDLIVTRYNDSKQTGLILNFENNGEIMRLGLLEPEGFDAEKLFNQVQKIKAEVDVLTAKKATFIRERAILTGGAKEAIQKKVQYANHLVEEIVAQETAEEDVHDDEKPKEEQEKDAVIESQEEAKEDSRIANSAMTVSDSFPTARILETQNIQNISDATLAESHEQQQVSPLQNDNEGEKRANVKAQYPQAVVPGHTVSDFDCAEIEPRVIRDIKKAEQSLIGRESSLELTSEPASLPKTDKKKGRMHKTFEILKTKLGGLSQKMRVHWNKMLHKQDQAL